MSADERCVSHRRLGYIRCVLPANHVNTPELSTHWGQGRSGRWHHWPASDLDTQCEFLFRARIRADALRAAKTGGDQ